jgi:hypothetical protein
VSNHPDNDQSELPKLYVKLAELQAARRVDDRKWEMQIALVEIEIRRVTKEEQS